MKRDVVAEAMAFAAQAHAGQYRDVGEPYIKHPAQVAAILTCVTDDPELIAAGWLHDVIEDTPVSYQVLVDRFGERIADLVMEVTEEVHPRGKYFPRLHSEAGVMLKFADRLSNLSAMDSWDEKRRQHYLKRSKFWYSEAQA